MEIQIKNAIYLEGYKLQLMFSDKLQRVVDFEKFLNQATNPMTRKFLELNKFKKFHIKYGDLVWGDYEMCFPIWDLYQAKI